MERANSFAKPKSFLFWSPRPLGQTFSAVGSFLGLWTTIQLYLQLSGPFLIEKYELLVWNFRLDVTLQSINWFARVPSKSNFSDEASTLQF